MSVSSDLRQILANQSTQDAKLDAIGNLLAAVADVVGVNDDATRQTLAKLSAEVRNNTGAVQADLASAPKQP